MVATALVEAGATVMIASRKGEDCERVAEELNALNAPGRAEGMTGDVSTEEGIARLSARSGNAPPSLISSSTMPALPGAKPMRTSPTRLGSAVLGVNVTGLFHLTRELTPLLEAAATDDDPARVVNLGSVMGTQPVAEGAYSYTASKAAVHHLTRTLAIEFARRRITVNAFAPGPFQSKMTAFATVGEGRAEKVGSRVPLGRIGAPSDIAGATLFLCSKGGSYVTGAIIPLDGGQAVQHGVALFEE